MTICNHFESLNALKIRHDTSIIKNEKDKIIHANEETRNLYSCART